MSSYDDNNGRLSVILKLCITIGLIFSIIFCIITCSQSFDTERKEKQYTYADYEKRENSKNNSTSQKPKRKPTRAELCKDELLQCVYKNQSKQVATATLLDKGYSETEIENAINSVNPNFKYAAKVRAELLAKNNSYKKKETYNALINEYKFTSSEADYAIKNADVDWNEDPLEIAKEILEKEGLSKIGIALKLESDYGFTTDQAVETMSKFNVNWKKVALYKGIDLRLSGISLDELYDELRLIYSFTKEEANYALIYVESYLEAFKLGIKRAYDKGESRVTVESYLSRMNRATDDEIEYVVNKINWNDVAMKEAKRLYKKGKSAYSIEDILRDKKFTESEIKYALKNY